MIVPQFLRFYTGYTAESVLSEPARRFFSLVNAMMRIKAEENIRDINNVAVGMSEQRQEIVTKLEKESKGISGIIDEINIVKGARK